MKYTYQFTDGTEQETEVSEELFKELTALDRAEKSNDRKETRRHISWDRLLEKGFAVRDYAQDIDFVLEWQDYYDEEKLREQLQRKVFHQFLSERQAEIFYQYKILKYRKVKIAKAVGVKEGAIRKHILKAEQIMSGPMYRVSRMFGAPKGHVYLDEIVYEEIRYLKGLLKLKK